MQRAAVHQLDKSQQRERSKLLGDFISFTSFLIYSATDAHRDGQADRQRHTHADSQARGDTVA